MDIICPESPDSLEQQNENDQNGKTNRELVIQGHYQPSKMPLEMTEILENIFFFCESTDTLKSCRLVNSLWGSEALQKLLQRAHLTVPIYLEELEKVNWKIYGQNHYSSTTSFLEKVASSWSPVKIRNVTVRSLFSLNLFQKVEIFGPNIKSIQIGRSIMELLAFDDIFQGLAQTMPKLEYLHLLHEDEAVYPDSLYRTLMPLLCLKKDRVVTLTLSHFHMVVDMDHEWDAILTDFENFETQADRIQIQNFKFTFYGSIGHVANSGVQIRSQLNRLSVLLTKMLSKSSKILTHLSINGCEKFLAQTDIPILPKLKKMQMTYCTLRDDPAVNPNVNNILEYSLPPNFKFSRHMPRLTDLDFYFNGPCNDFPIPQPAIFNIWQDILGSSGPTESVKILTCSDALCDLNLVPVLSTFRRVERLAILRLTNFAHLGPAIWTWAKGLKILDLFIRLEEQSAKISCFDQIFTGFTSGTVDRIKNSQISTTSSDDLRRLNELRVHPSILDLPELENLTMKLEGPVLKVLPKKILWVAGQFAFALHPKLQVFIYTELCHPRQRAIDAMEQVGRLPNVTIV